MRVKILGTAASEGIPGIFCTCPVCEHARNTGGKNIRTRSQTLINDRYLVDFPPDTLLHALHHHLNLAAVEHLLVTHDHDDHFYPNDLKYRRPPFGYNNAYPPLQIYGPTAVRQKYLDFLEEEKAPELDAYVKIHELQAFQTYQLGKLKVIPLPALHSKNAECFIYIIAEGGKRLLYGHDSGFFPEASWQEIRKYYFDCIILDCTTGIEPDGKNHMGIEDTIKVRRELLAGESADAKTRFILSHFSHNGQLMHEQLEKIGRKNGFWIAFDGFELEF